MNGKRNAISPDVHTKTNHEGQTVHQLTALETLFSKVLGSFFGEGTFYENRSAEKDFKNVVSLINAVADDDKEYALKIAMLGRQHNMIQFPLAVLTACFNDSRFKGDSFRELGNGQNKLQKYSNSIIRRGRDIVDVMAMQLAMYSDIPVPMQLRKALKRKLETMDEYQLSKALSTSREVSLADCIKLLHPDEKNSKVSKGFFKRVIENDVSFGNDNKQIQSELSKRNNANSGSNISDVKDSLDTSSVMAVLKNLVGLYRTGLFDDREAVNIVCNRLTDPVQIRNSRLLPFRFYSAYKQISLLPSSYGRNMIMDALVKALDISVENMPKLDGFNAILIDCSGSMCSPVSEKSAVEAIEIAQLLGAICYKRGVGDIYLFSNYCTKLNGISVHSTVIDLMHSMRSFVGGGTYIDKAFQSIAANAAVSPYDNLILLSDNDCYTYNGKVFSMGGEHTDTLLNSLFSKGFIKKFYVNNLLGNDFVVANVEDFRKNLISGFSEKIVEMINIYSNLGKGESDVRVLIDSLLNKPTN